MATRRFATLCGLFSLAALLAQHLRGDETQKPDDGSWQIHGRVVDEQGKPVDDFVGATWWSSNGVTWGDHGEPLKVEGRYKMAHAYCQHEGVLAAEPHALVKKLPGGEFVTTIEDRPRESIFVTDAEQKRGGFVSVEKTDSDKPVTITLLPLVRVTGKIYCPQAQRIPDWTNAVVHPIGDQENYLHFTDCSSLNGEFSLLLPPGEYDLDVHSSSPDAHMPRPAEREAHDAPADMPSYIGGIRLEVPRGQASMDLGTLNVIIPKGRGDYSAFYGKEPPSLDITDARGISKDVKLADLRGKWVLLDFWTLHCGPCIGRSLPQLAKLYGEHAADASRFEILAICVTKQDKIQSLADYEHAEKPIADETWNGKRLPFPVLIDGEGKTNDAFGIGSYPKALLIDPDGHLVKWGDETMLEEKLAEKQ